MIVQEIILTCKRQQVSGKLSGKMFPPGVDPLDPFAVPIKTYSNTFKGKRLTVADN